jgi:hypothetical protein
MGAAWTKRLGSTLALLSIATGASADDLPPLPEPRPPAATLKSVRPKVTADPAPSTGQATPASSKDDSSPAGRSEAEALRAETLARLDKLPKKGDKTATAETRALREALEDRLRCLDEYDKAVKDRLAAENPEPSPDKLAAEWKADLERTKAVLDQAAKQADVLLPSAFRNLPEKVPDSVRSEMKDSIDTAQSELKDWSTKLEQARPDTARKPGAALAALRASRDKTFQKVASLKARNLERAAETAEARTPEARDLARETRVNDQWEARVESERLRAQEVQITLESRRSELIGLNLQVLDAHVQLAGKTLERMKLGYREMTERQEKDLHRAAVKEQTKAERSDDPLERYKAKRAAEILELEARVLKSESALTTNPSPSFEEQRALADRAQTDFTSIKHLLDDGKVSHLDALRLNNDFRRIGAERARIVRNELAIAADRLARAENLLSAVEMEMIYDNRDDRFELENLREHLPRSQHSKAIAVFDEFERKHLELLERRRCALEKHAARAEQTHDQIERRLRILDDHFGFIRTNLFWVRDEEPVGAVTLVQAEREVRQLGRASLRIAADAWNVPSWGRISPEFLAASLGLIVLPWPFHRLRRTLRRVVDVATPAADE